MQPREQNSGTKHRGPTLRGRTSRTKDQGSTFRGQSAVRDHNSWTEVPGLKQSSGGELQDQKSCTEIQGPKIKEDQGPKLRGPSQRARDQAPKFWNQNSRNKVQGRKLRDQGSGTKQKERKLKGQRPTQSLIPGARIQGPTFGDQKNCRDVDSSTKAQGPMLRDQVSGTKAQGLQYRGQNLGAKHQRSGDEMIWEHCSGTTDQGPNLRDTSAQNPGSNVQGPKRMGQSSGTMHRGQCSGWQSTDSGRLAEVAGSAPNVVQSRIGECPELCRC